ncbi:type II toxin-antitoxin system VapC family toxin [Haladaptatus sp. DFWS20]|uniref:type II toxin-antitoxin system VapC family toxin n=1 Tax=Haladaptatus sp. DFWS20 TaxID=3403467 RepID=UPI003EC0851B
MRYFIDTNIFIAALTDEPNRGDVAVDFLNLEANFYTSLLNVMELRSVLGKKKQLKHGRVAELERRVTSQVEIVVPDASDMLAANKRHQETLIYPMDCLILACAESQDTALVSFDKELIEAGARSPEEITDDS